MTEDPEHDDESYDIDLGATKAVAAPAPVQVVSPVPPVEVAQSAAKETSFGRLPQQLGRYTLTKRLGIGGMAEVFLAEQSGAAGFKKACVVKRMLGHLALQPKFVDMFLREAHLAATLHHANIVQIWDLGEVDGQYFIAMEHIDGLPLNVLARNAWRHGKAVPMEVICCALHDAAEGLAAAHERKDADGQPAPIVHRDISPDNLMIDRDGVTKILDFGIARTLDSERTRAGEIKGKVPFMALEQLRGEIIDGRADVYALGVTAYWLLTGKRPFTGPTDAALIEAILMQTARPPVEINPHIPAELNSLVMRMLAKDKDQRISSVREIATALEHVVAQRKSVVAPFIRAVMDRPVTTESNDVVSVPSGFVPSTPHSDAISSGWRQNQLDASKSRTDLVMRAAAAAVASMPLRVAPATQPTAESATEPEEVEPMPESTGVSRPVAIAAAVALLGALAVIVVLMRGPSAEDHAAPSVVVAPPPSVTPPPPVAPPPPVEPPPPAETSPKLVDDKGPAGKAPPAARREVVVKGPPDVEWIVDGKPAGTGNRTLKVSASAKSIVALDVKRGARTTVAVGAGAIDYSKLPRGKLQPRAKPFADIFLGNSSLGATPFPAIDVVAGTYTVRFVYKGKEQSKSVTVEPGQIARPAADFTQ